MEWFFAALGLVILVLAGDMLVKGAVNLSLRVGIPALIVSLTIVAFGTSAPELLSQFRRCLSVHRDWPLAMWLVRTRQTYCLCLGCPL